MKASEVLVHLRAVLEIVDTKSYMTAEQQEVLRKARAVAGAKR